MKKVVLFISFLIVSFILLMENAYSWQGMKISPLHVDGRYLKDTSGNVVNLKGGWMQPIEAWFNGNRYKNPTNWTDPNSVAPMLNFLKEAADVMSDTSPRYGTNHGWYNTFVRINTDMIGGWTHENGLVDTNQFNGWINNFLVPYANHLRSRGLYLVICATGPINTPNNGTRNCGQIEQQRLRTFWKTVANANGIKNADNVMFELMNEPVEIESSPGNGDWGFGQDKYFLAFRNWIQPVIDDIRSTGANNIIWVPTLEWQGSPYQHARYPFSGTNCGIAAHYYPAYGGCYDNKNCHNNLWNNNYKPATDRWPMIITENFWFPEDNGLCSGSTINYGNTLKANIDAAGNVSYMIGFLSDLLVDLVTSSPTNCNLSLKEGALAAFSWWHGYYIGCEPTTIIPYIQVNDGTWQNKSNISIYKGDKIKLGPQPDISGIWNWIGCGITTNNLREVTIYPENSCKATVMFTNTCGATSMQSFSININLVIEEGEYSLIAKHSGKAITVYGGNTNNGTKLEQRSYSSSNLSQKFKISHLSDGWHKIVPLISNDKAIGVSNGSTNDGANLNIWTYLATNYQQWKFEDAGEGYYRIVARHSGKCVDVSGVSTADGADIIQWSCHGGTNQMFLLEKHNNTGIKEKFSSNFIVYPTITNEFIKISHDVLDNNAIVEIYNELGMLCISSKLSVDNNVINVSKLPSGLYIVKIRYVNTVLKGYFIKK